MRRSSETTGDYSGDVIQGLGLLGFVHLWTTAEGSRCFVHPDDPGQAEIFVNPLIAEAHSAQALLVGARRVVNRQALIGAPHDLLREQELAAMERMMTQLPQGGRVNRGTGQVRHWSGNRRR